MQISDTANVIYYLAKRKIAKSFTPIMCTLIGRIWIKSDEFYSYMLRIKLFASLRQIFHHLFGIEIVRGKNKPIDHDRLKFFLHAGAIGLLFRGL